MPLKVKIDIQNKYLDRINGLRKVAPLLNDLGVSLDFSKDGGAEDVLFAEDKVVVEGGKAIRQGAPLVVFERTASSVVSSFNSRRQLIKRPSTRKWIKEMALRDQRINNAPLLDGRYHLALLEPGSSGIAAPELLLSPADMLKIEPLLPMFEQERYNPLRDKGGLAWRHRKIDVLCAGMVDYTFPALTRHRTRALDLIRRHTPHHVIVSGAIVPQDIYFDLLRNTKVFVSPYGYGEYSFKDFEALFAGCLVVKADSRHVTTYGFDIFGDGGYCIQTAPDMADLPETIERIFADQDAARVTAQRAGEALRAAFDPQAYAQRMAKVFRAAADGQPEPDGDAFEPAGTHFTGQDNPSMGEQGDAGRAAVAISALAAFSVLDENEARGLAAEAERAPERAGRIVRRAVWQKVKADYAKRWVCTEVDARRRLWVRLGQPSDAQLIAGTFEPENTALVRRALTPGGTFVDVGANVGWYSMIVGGFYADHGGGQVVAIEPIPEVFARLVDAARLSGLEGIVKAHNVAVAGEDGEAAFRLSDSHLAGSHLASGGGKTRSEDIPVKTRRASSLLDPAWRVDMIKIDIEGGEPAFFAHAGDFLAATAPPILSEVHGPKLKLVGGTTAGDYVRGIAALGYTPLLVGRRGRLRRLKDAEPPEDDVTNMLFLKPEQFARFGFEG